MSSALSFFRARLALVTGGGSGIGRSVCHALAKEGRRVIVANINLDGAKTTVESLPGLFKLVSSLCALMSEYQCQLNYHKVICVH
ncbi:hypothetical protein HPB47_017730 [Ixodes persulcatus]|uniref:Uncharacterized protein n=1 Tax=Ixodes persulcatus TaxID=34615 RepID=A0AC60QML5_IXOPE|nr:hypothetical protein HPB47_017730 [Ixodes persulcatus]